MIWEKESYWENKGITSLEEGGVYRMSDSRHFLAIHMPIDGWFLFECIPSFENGKEDWDIGYRVRQNDGRKVVLGFKFANEVGAVLIEQGEWPWDDGVASMVPCRLVGKFRLAKFAAELVDHATLPWKGGA